MVNRRAGLPLPSDWLRELVEEQDAGGGLAAQIHLLARRHPSLLRSILRDEGVRARRGLRGPRSPPRSQPSGPAFPCRYERREIDHADVASPPCGRSRGHRPGRRGVGGGPGGLLLPRRRRHQRHCRRLHGVGCVTVFAALGMRATRQAAGRTAGVEARFWRLMSYGFMSWALGCVPYFAFLAGGGDVASPAAWSQIGFLLAYPFWYVGLWKLRQPALVESRRGLFEGFAIELSAFLMLGFVVIGTLWYSSLSASGNIAQLVPVTLDLLLAGRPLQRGPALHGHPPDGVRLVRLLLRRAGRHRRAGDVRGHARRPRHGDRSDDARLHRRDGAHPPRRPTSAAGDRGPGRARNVQDDPRGHRPRAGRPRERPRARSPEAGGVDRRRVPLLAALGPAPGPRRLDTDAISGFLETRAFSRHVAGVVQAASSAHPAIVVAVDLDGFGRWNAQNGYGAGDTLLTGVASRLEASPLAGGIWSRLGADRFAWIGIGHDASAARHLAEVVCGVAADNLGELGARATFVVLPDDATTAVNAMAAVEEGLAAAKAGRRRVVAFDHGRLDGVDYSAGYTASLAQRRAAIVEILRDPRTIATVFQPIVSLDNGRTVGFEALSRFRAEPERPPDKWIGEAHAVGLGLEVEVECVRRACRHRATLPEDAYLSINMSPDAVLFPEMDGALGDGSLEGLVIEITEHEAVRDYARLASRLADYRGRGAKVAIDDTGAGHASMRHVTQLAPDYIKVDRSLIQDLHLDHAKRALVRSMVTLEKELGAEVVAEGIESTEELRALRELGVPLGQGFLLARPANEPRPAPWTVESLELSGSFARTPGD